MIRYTSAVVTLAVTSDNKVFIELEETPRGKVILILYAFRKAASRLGRTNLEE